MKLKELTEALSVASIQKFMARCSVGTWNLGMDGKVTVTGGITIPYSAINDMPDPTKLPFRFSRINGNFQLGETDTTEMCPLQSAYGFPEFVTSSFIAFNLLHFKSMEKFPFEVGLNFKIINSSLTSLQHIPKIGDGMTEIAFTNAQFPSLDVFKDVKLDCSALYLSSPKITSLEGLDEKLDTTAAFLVIDDKQIKSNLLSLLNIKSLHTVTTMNLSVQPKLWSIMNQHLDGDRDIFECQQELIDAGFEEYAQL